jgi:hypothetical protein
MTTSFRPFPFLLISAATIGLLASPGRVQAFGGPPGGPFGNGSYFPNDGTFSAVVRGTNLTGTLQFSTTEGSGPSSSTSTTTSGEGAGGGTAAASTTSTSGTGGVGSTGIANIYYNGRTYNGNSQGSLNPESSAMTVMFQANSAGQGEQTRTVSRVVDLGDTVEITTTINPDGTVVQNETITPNREVVPAREISYFDTYYMNGFVDCKTSNAFPNQKFKGSGQMFTQEINFNLGNSDPRLAEVGPIPLSVTGVRLSNTASSFATSLVRSPSVNTTTVLIP